MKILLLGHMTPVAQLGIQLPIVFSFAIAPMIFVLLHLYLLLRYGMVRANVQQLLDDLPSAVAVSADRERVFQLLANVEFVNGVPLLRHPLRRQIPSAFRS